MVFALPCITQRGSSHVCIPRVYIPRNGRQALRDGAGLHDAQDLGRPHGLAARAHDQGESSPPCPNSILLETSFSRHKLGDKELLGRRPTRTIFHLGLHVAGSSITWEVTGLV